MKIWEAKLILGFDTNENNICSFKFKYKDKDYQINEKTNEWIYIRDWNIDRIPMDMIIERGYYKFTYEVKQGFDRELTKDELDKLKENMKDKLIKYLNKEKEIYINKMNNEIKTVKEFE